MNPAPHRSIHVKPRWGRQGKYFSGTLLGNAFAKHLLVEVFCFCVVLSDTAIKELGRLRRKIIMACLTIVMVLPTKVWKINTPQPLQCTGVSLRELLKGKGPMSQYLWTNGPSGINFKNNISHLKH
jgi:hypothetical protein